MNPLIAFTLIAIAATIGNIIAVKTKSIVSMLFTLSFIFLIAFWLGLPTTIFEDSTLLAFGSMLIPILLVHIGTMMNIQQLIEQWRTVLIAGAALVGIATFVILIGQFILGQEEAMIAAAPISGGVIAGIIMGDAAASIGRGDLQILASLLVVVQGFVGYPIASYALNREARKLKKEFQANPVRSKNQVHEKDTSPKKAPLISEKYHSNEYYLAKVAIVASLSLIISQTVNEVLGANVLDVNILSLILGIIAHQIGVLESQPLAKANSYGISMLALTVVVISSLSQATPQVLLDLLPIMVGALLLGAVGIIIFSAIIGKLLNYSFWMSISIGVSALFGFPGTFIVPNEVAKVVGETSEEKQYILDRIQPQMLVAGFVTVSIASVLLAGVLAPLVIN